jgi:hypothetical protein
MVKCERDPGEQHVTEHAETKVGATIHEERQEEEDGTGQHEHDGLPLYAVAPGYGARASVAGDASDEWGA